ncbi:MAG: DUF1576 domain-containing protein [Clostridiaceae bacterium]|nr:DUF1576 domain-containing protein [Clostridiaceae bacterium]
MEKSMDLKARVQEKSSEDGKMQAIPVSEDTKYLVMLAYAVFVLASAFVFNSFHEIIGGMKDIIVAPGILVTDYMVIGNIGASLFNSGLLMLAALVIARKSQANMNGPVIAAILTIGGFALFGKNIYNVWSVILGVYIHSLVHKEKFNKFILVAFFGTALGPLVGQVSFGYGFSPALAIVAANAAGILAGFVLPSLASHFVKFHQGFNLYNIGFTAGITGTFFMVVFRAFGLQHDTVLIVAEGHNSVFGIYLSVLFASMIVMGFLFNDKSFKGYKDLLKHPGRLVADFVTLNGFGLSFINMGILGLITTSYILLVNGELNGPIIGGIFTVVGFGAFGKHTKNVMPILIGVYIATLLQIWDVNSTGALLAALFGTTLAPISGQFGWKFGIVAGFLHMAMVMNVGILHGGMNLYNNGFSGGIVAATLVPIIESFKSNKEE